LTVLVAGGAADPSLRALLAALSRRGTAHTALLVGPDSHPGLSWDLQTDALRLDGRRVSPTAVFLRHDVFTHQQDGRKASARRARGWFAAVKGWALAHPSVRLLNRHGPGAANKLAALRLAAACGLDVPQTRVDNTLGGLDGFLPGQQRVAKPVAGGGLCRPLDEDSLTARSRGGVLPTPAIVQQRLVPPELRVYRVGERLLGYQLSSPSLDYREKQDARLAPVPVPSPIARGLVALAQQLRLDWLAADFKTDPRTGRLCFLEVNTAPMFAAFDHVDGGRLADALVEALAYSPSQR